MKKILSILAIALLASCTAEKIEEPKDCNCDKVVDVVTLKVVGTTSGSTITYRYTTINECSGVQRTSGWGREVVKIGECR